MVIAVKNLLFSTSITCTGSHSRLTPLTPRSKCLHEEPLTEGCDASVKFFMDQQVFAASYLEVFNGNYSQTSAQRSGLEASPVRSS